MQKELLITEAEMAKLVVEYKQRLQQALFSESFIQVKSTYIKSQTRKLNVKWSFEFEDDK